MPGGGTIEPQGVTPDKALAYWQSKRPVSAAEFDKLDSAAKSRAFAVAGLTKQDMVSDLHASLYAAIQNGETIEQWKRRIPDILAAQGWNGHRLENILEPTSRPPIMRGAMPKCGK